MSKPINQCDGCRRGLPLKDGAHYEDLPVMSCTKDRYTKSNRPWEVYAFDWRVVVDPEGAVVADVRTSDRDDSYLIAAAPELLAVCERLAEDLEDGHWQNTKAELQALVKKARG